MEQQIKREAKSKSFLVAGNFIIMEHAGGGGGPGAERKVFGVPLEVIMQRPNEKRIPAIVKKMILFLNAEGGFSFVSSPFSCCPYHPSCSNIFSCLPFAST